MQKELSENLQTLYSQIEKRLDKLSPGEQQQYLEGMVNAFTAMRIFASPLEAMPFDREEFASNVNAHVYSKIYHLGLQPSTETVESINQSKEGRASAYAFAAKLQEILGEELTRDQKGNLDNALGIYAIEKQNK